MQNTLLSSANTDLENIPLQLSHGSQKPDARIAVVHEWLTTYAGSERLVEQFLKLYPASDLYTLVDFLHDSQRGFLNGVKPHVSFLQQMPLASKFFRHYLPLMPFAVEQFDVSDYDLIISSHHAVAKGILTGPHQLHLCYIHTPMRYAWDLHHQYLQQENLHWGLKGLLARLSLHYLRLWDSISANNVDAYIANSQFIARRVEKYYRRPAKVIYPPVDVEKFPLQVKKQDYYVTASRMVPYKKIDLIVDAFTAMPDKKLVVIGDGPCAEKIKQKAGPNIQFLGHTDFDTLLHHFQNAAAFIFATEEDFGITPVEAQACGTPVIAYGRGGCLETIRGLGDSSKSNNLNDLNNLNSLDGLDHQAPTGIFFQNQTVNDIVTALLIFEKNRNVFDPYACRQNALRFSTERFLTEFNTFVNEAYQSFKIFGKVVA